jgi:hypothetical protein
MEGAWQGRCSVACASRFAASEAEEGPPVTEVLDRDHLTAVFLGRYVEHLVAVTCNLRALS